MTQVKQSYTGSDLGRIQQEAVTRVRQMQDKAHQNSGYGGATFRNWSTNPNFRRSGQPSHRPPPPPPDPPAHTPSPQKPPEDPTPGNFRKQEQDNTERKQAYSAEEKTGQAGQQPRPGRPPNPGPAPEKPKDTTLLQDILGGVGLDDDRILILGLILILINDKADTTLILALLYLLL